MSIVPSLIGYELPSRGVSRQDNRSVPMRATLTMFFTVWVAGTAMAQSPEQASQAGGRGTESHSTDVPRQNGAENGTTDLLAGEFSSQWQFFNSDPSAASSQVWRVIRETADSEPVLVCSGEPKGFAFTSEKLGDFELTLEWKYPTDANGNSGVLVYTQNEPRIWPTCVQVQLHQPKAGSIFPSGDAKTDNTVDAAPDLARPVNTWNECRIISRDGRITVEVNRMKAGEITGAKPSVGSIALQSEGSEVHFRRIRLKKLKAEPKPPENDSAGQTCGEPFAPLIISPSSCFDGSPGIRQDRHHRTVWTCEEHEDCQGETTVVTYIWAVETVPEGCTWSEIQSWSRKRRSSSAAKNAGVSRTLFPVNTTSVVNPVDP